MDLNIGFKADEKYVSTNLPLLKAWEIHDVKFDGFEYSKFAGKKDPSATYEVLKIKFKNDNGQFVHTLFAPKPGDEVRSKRTNSNGHEMENPSNLETFTKTIGHVLTEVCPEALNKLSGKSTTFEKLCKFLEKETASKVGFETKIKLIGDKDNKPKFPYLLSVFEVGGDAVITNNCVGKNLGFTAYEMEQKKKVENAKPTQMPSLNSDSNLTTNNDSPIKEEESDDLDFNL